MPTNNVFTDGRWRERWVLSYIFDYFIIVICILAFSALDKTEPFHQPWSLANPSLQYPYADPERISAAWCGVIACAFPLLCVVVWTMMVDGRYSHHKPATKGKKAIITGGGPWTMGDRLWEMNCAILGLGLSVAGAIVITGALKNATGKPRPDIIDRCQPNSTMIPDLENRHYELVHYEVCTTQGTPELKDGFKSWPSGHASTSFSGLGYLSLFIAGKLHIMDNRGEVWKTLLVLIPLLAAGLVTVSRIMDARHHPFDVLSGATLGMTTAWVAYRQYFPPVSHAAAKGRAYPPRSWGTDHAQQAEMYEQPMDAASRLEQGRAGSSDSIDSESALGQRRRYVPGAQSIPRKDPAAASNPFQERQHRESSGSEDYEMAARPMRSGTMDTVNTMPPVHRHTTEEYQNTEYTGSTPYRLSGPSIDIGGRAEPLNSPDGGARPLRLGRISPPPPQPPPHLPTQ